MNDKPALQSALDHLAHVFTKEMPFLKPFNLQVKNLDSNSITAHFEMDPALIGNMMQTILHGGVASTVLDSVGGMVAIAAAFSRLENLSNEEQLSCLAKVSTIDLHVNYLRPGKGKHFVANAQLIRAGNKIAAVRTELTNDEGTLIATGDGNYLIG